jgi:transcriptional regulator with XRE-family HTH domain
MGHNEVDREAGVSAGTTSRYESGDRGARTGGYGNTVAKIAAALGVRKDWLSQGEEPMRVPVAESSGAPASPILRNHPQWVQLIAEAKKIRRGLTDADFERIADSPFLFGPLESVDAVLLADLASDVADWAARTSAK